MCGITWTLILTGVPCSSWTLPTADSVLDLSDAGPQYQTQDYPAPPNITGTTDGQLRVDVSAALNPYNGRVDWRLKAIDTATGLLPDDPLAGFLPPEDGTGHGQGHVSFPSSPGPA